jgi:two-component system OmpR family response regulator
MHILMITDAPGIAKFIRRGLTGEGWTMDSMGLAEAMGTLSAFETCDVILLDLQEAANQRIEPLEAVRSACPELPILVLAPRTAEGAGTPALRKPNVEVMAKPFAFDDLMARLDSFSLRGAPARQKNRFDFGVFSFDVPGSSVRIGQRHVPLTATECALLLILVQNKGRACASDWLLQVVWDTQNPGMTSPVDDTVAALRRKFGPHATMIGTARQYGYRFDPEADRVK